jgi:hypothetical protein
MMLNRLEPNNTAVTEYQRTNNAEILSGCIVTFQYQQSRSKISPIKTVGFPQQRDGRVPGAVAVKRDNGGDTGNPHCCKEDGTPTKAETDQSGFCGIDVRAPTQGADRELNISQLLFLPGHIEGHSRG